MMMFAKTIIICITFTQFSIVENRESAFTLSVSEPLNVVSEKFLSFSIELNDFLENLNGNDHVKFQHLKPAFIRIDGQLGGKNSTENESFPLESIRRWFADTGLVPVFLITHDAFSNDTWKLQDLNINEDYYWEMRYDCGNMSPSTYQEDMKTLKELLTRYPHAKIVGGNACASTNWGRKIEEKLNGTADAIIYETSFSKQMLKTEMSKWTILAQFKNSESYKTVLQWASQVTQSALNGFEVAFWKTSVKSLLDSPLFWLTSMYKQLVGETVLNLNRNSRMQFGVEISAHCSKQYSGALVFVIVNAGKDNFTAAIMTAGLETKKIEAQSYIVTSDEHSDVYLNGAKLNTEHLVFIPKVQTLEVETALNLSVPPKSVGFFVLPSAKIPICAANTSGIDEIPILSRSKFFDLPRTSRLDAFRQKMKKLKSKNQPQHESFGSFRTMDDFNDFLARKRWNSNLHDKTEQLDRRQYLVELTDDEIKQLLFERAMIKNNKSISDKELRKVLKNADKIKRFTAVRTLSRKLGHYPKRVVKRDVNLRVPYRKVASDGSVLADFAPISIEEQLKPGEKYVDDRLKFLKGPGNGKSDKDEEKSDFTILEDFETNNSRDDLREFDEGSSYEDLDSMPYGRIKRNARNPSKDLKNEMIRKRHNIDSQISTKLKYLKGKVENRIKMNNWIRNKQKQNLKDLRNKRMSSNGSKRFTYYTPKMLNERAAGDSDRRMIKKMPSYSREDVADFLPSKRSQRALSSVDITENLIENDNDNKFIKMKAVLDHIVNAESTTNFITPSMKTNRNFDNSTVITPSKPSSLEEELVSGKSFIQTMMDQFTGFIGKVYGKVSEYLMS